MDKNIHTVDNMKKIKLTLETGTSRDSMDLSDQPFSFQFIYGVGSEGLCLFEKALFEKKIGEETVFRVDPHQTSEVFGHLKQSLAFSLPFEATFYLKSTVKAIQTVDNRELIQAIAAGGGSSNCGCGCDGDCSC